MHRLFSLHHNATFPATHLERLTTQQRQFNSPNNFARSIELEKERSAVVKTVGEILNGKGNDIWSISPNATVYEALELMADKNIGAVLVIDDDNLVGILSERDYARKVILKGLASKETPVRKIMTEKVICVQTTQTAEECMALMTDKHIRHLPVIKDGQLVGVISIGDVVKAIISDQEFTIEQLENYITGGAYQSREAVI
ncbi:MAG: CBS domain-containing protein [Anaerolineae bacterium]|nr:CBS domain-containing protein [Anaerolineae bacterium]